MLSDLNISRISKFIMNNPDLLCVISLGPKKRLMENPTIGGVDCRNGLHVKYISSGLYQNLIHILSRELHIDLPDITEAIRFSLGNTARRRHVTKIKLHVGEGSGMADVFLPYDIYAVDAGRTVTRFVYTGLPYSLDALRIKYGNIFFDFSSPRDPTPVESGSSFTLSLCELCFGISRIPKTFAEYMEMTHD